MGRALALHLAQEGYTVAVTVREHDPIDDLIEEASAFVGCIRSFACDVTDEAGMARTVDRIESEAGPIVLAVFNAGNYLPTYGENLSVQNFRSTYEVNVFGVLNGMVPAVHKMKSRQRGHIVLIGSVTAYFGWPTLAAYGATKAALNNMAEALQYDLAKMNIRIQIFNPGFINTPLVANNTIAMPPALMPVEKAAVRMLQAIKTGGFEVTFPRRLTWGMKLLSKMPKWVIFQFISFATRWKGRPLLHRQPDQS